jgi:hypothetical protein
VYEVPCSWPHKGLKGMPFAVFRCTVISSGVGSDGGVGGGAGGYCDRYILGDYVICYSYTGETDPSP